MFTLKHVCIIPYPEILFQIFNEHDKKKVHFACLVIVEMEELCLLNSILLVGVLHLKCPSNIIQYIPNSVYINSC